MTTVITYKRFERFWHWTQALLIVLLAITGLDVRYDAIALLDFELAVTAHQYLAWALIVLIAFAIFWHFTTGEWKQYLPTRIHLREWVDYYRAGIFRGDAHPTRSQAAKLNPLQRLAYLTLKLAIFPLVVLSGLLYLFYNELVAAGWLWNDLSLIAALHTAGAYLLIAFIVAHVYLTTTGETPLAHLKGMITGRSEHEHPPAQRPST
jgi:formate dehydrogenase gamma subunit